MRFSTAIAAAAAFAAGAFAQESTLALDIDKSGIDISTIANTELVSYANSSIWLGGIKYESYSEPFLVQGAISFTSWHQTPTGWQNVYVYENETQPVGLTIPHSGAVPEGATISGFSYDTDGYLTFNGEYNFWGCQNALQASLEAYEIWWFGAGEPNGVGCIGPLYLYDIGFTTIG